MTISINEMKKMIKLANHLDSIGLHSEADVVDQALTKMAQTGRRIDTSGVGVVGGGLPARNPLGRSAQYYIVNGAIWAYGFSPGVCKLFTAPDGKDYIKEWPDENTKNSFITQAGEYFSADYVKFIDNNRTAVDKGSLIGKLNEVLNCIPMAGAGGTAGTTPTRTPTPTPRQGGCLVTLPSNPGTTYDYQPSSDTFSVVGGQGRIGYVFRNGSRGYNTLMAEGKGTCIRRTAPTQQPATAPQIQMGESMTGTQVDGGFEGYQGAPRDPETMRMMRARQQAERAGTRRVYEGKTQREMMQGLREGQAEERADLRSDLSAARQRYRESKR